MSLSEKSVEGLIARDFRFVNNANARGLKKAITSLGCVLFSTKLNISFVVTFVMSKSALLGTDRE